MEMIFLSEETKSYNIQLSSLLAKIFPLAYKDSSDEEVKNCIQKDRIAIAAIEQDILLGFVGAIGAIRKHRLGTPSFACKR